MLSVWSYSLHLQFTIHNNFFQKRHVTKIMIVHWICIQHWKFVTLCPPQFWMPFWLVKPIFGLYIIDGKKIWKSESCRVVWLAFHSSLSYLLKCFFSCWNRRDFRPAYSKLGLPTCKFVPWYSTAWFNCNCYQSYAEDDWRFTGNDTSNRGPGQPKPQQYLFFLFKVRKSCRWI